MKEEKGEEVDKLFKKGLEDPVNEATYREADWDAMEQLLEKGKKRPALILWLPWLGSAAALLLLFLGWLWFRPQVTTEGGKKDQPQLAVKQQPKQDTNTSGGATRHNAADSSKQKILNPAGYANNPAHHGGQKNANRSLPYSPVGPAAVLPGKDSKAVNPGALASNPAVKKQDKKDLVTVDAQKQPVDAQNLAVNTAPATNKKELGVDDAQKQKADANALVANKVVPGKNDTGAVAHGQKKPADANVVAQNKPKVKVKGLGQNRAIFAVSAIATTDLNGVNSLQGSRVGGNLGALFSVNVNKWTFTTGMMYSIKPYQERYADYHTSYVFQYQNPSSIGVNCKMLDIPLNVNYQVYKNHGNKITVGTWLSSYIILREDYKFNYENAYAQGPSGYSVINKNRNILGVLNLDATYDHQINSKFGISFQPYVKLPLSNVGASQVKLQSAGVAVGLSWNLNSFKKPN